MNKYCEKFKINTTYIEDTQNWIRYIHKKDLIWDISCEKVCWETKIKTCSILNWFDNLLLENRDFLRKNEERDVFWDKIKKF